MMLAHDLACCLLAVAHEWRSDDWREVKYIAEVDLQVRAFDGGPRSGDATGLLAYVAANEDLAEGLAAWSVRSAVAA